MNANWGSRHVTNTSSDTSTTTVASTVAPAVAHTYAVDEFYFLTSPRHHIYQHYPDDPYWQVSRVTYVYIIYSGGNGGGNGGGGGDNGGGSGGGGGGGGGGNKYLFTNKVNAINYTTLINNTLEGKNGEKK